MLTDESHDPVTDTTKAQIQDEITNLVPDVKDLCDLMLDSGTRSRNAIHAGMCALGVAREAIDDGRLIIPLQVLGSLSGSLLWAGIDLMGLRAFLLGGRPADLDMDIAVTEAQLAHFERARDFVVQELALVSRGETAALEVAWFMMTNTVDLMRAAGLPSAPCPSPTAE